MASIDIITEKVNSLRNGEKIKIKKINSDIYLLDPLTKMVAPGSINCCTKEEIKLISDMQKILAGLNNETVLEIEIYTDALMKMVAPGSANCCISR